MLVLDASGFPKRFEEMLQKLADGLHKKGTVKRYDKVLERLGRMKEKYSRAAQYYDITVTQDAKAASEQGVAKEKPRTPFGVRGQSLRGTHTHAIGEAESSARTGLYATGVPICGATVFAASAAACRESGVAGVVAPRQFAAPAQIRGCFRSG